jgi:lysophospholipase L1-like esterase
MRFRICLVLAALAWLPQSGAQDARDGERWVATWGTAQQFAAEAPLPWVEPPPRAANEPAPVSPIPPLPASFSNETVRMIVRSSIGGSRARVTLSNALGLQPVRIGAAHVALHERDGRLVAGSSRALTFGGRAAVTLEPGALIVSDDVDLAVPPLAELAVSLYLPQQTGKPTAHELGLNTTYVVPGDAAGAVTLPRAATNRSYFWLAGIEVLARRGSGTIVAFGDSITDGFSTTPDTHRAWPALLAAKLQSDPATAHWGVVNAGISGNRIRRDIVGASALARFDRDVLSRGGVGWLILFEGINDITFSALPRAPAEQRATAEQVIEGLSQLVDRAHAHGIKVMGATLMPMGGLWLHNAQTEAVRAAVNAWIRTGGKFDAIVDFDAVTRDPARPERLRAELDSGDHIHPNDAGNAAMADAIELAAFDR